MIDALGVPTVRGAVAAGLVLVPIVAVACSPWSRLTALVLLATIAALNGALADRRAIVTTVTVTTVVTFAASLVTGVDPAVPLLGAALIAVLAFMTGVAAPHGLMSVGAVEIILAAHLLVDPHSLDDGLGSSSVTWSGALRLAVVALAAGAWVLVIRLVVLPGSRPPERVRPSIPYGAVLAAVCGTFALICLVWFRNTNMWWTVLTVALVLQPAARDTELRAAHRIAGTFVGATLAAIAAAMIGSESVLLVVGVAAGIACVVLTVTHAAYWLYATAVTVSVMLLTYTPSDLLVGVAARITCTLLASAASVLTVLCVERWRQRPTAPANAARGRSPVRDSPRLRAAAPDSSGNQPRAVPHGTDVP